VSNHFFAPALYICVRYFLRPIAPRVVDCGMPAVTTSVPRLAFLICW
jgi:hypothetical protein